MKKVFLKKQALILTLVAALGVAVYLNYYFSDRGLSVDNSASDGSNLGEAIFVKDKDNSGENGDDGAVSVGAKVSYFDTARQNREKARDEAMDLIKDIAADVQTDAAAAQKALDKTTALADAVAKEARIEGLIKAKGFKDCVVYMTDQNCSVVVQAENLSPTETLKITEIVTAQAGIAAQNINIMAVK